MKKTRLVPLDSSAVNVRLGLCAAALVGTAGAIPEADAAIVTFNTAIPIPATPAGVYINFLTGATGISQFSGWDFNPYLANGGTQLGFYWSQSPAGAAAGVAATTTGPYLDLAVGTVVGAASTYTNVILATTGSPFRTTGTHILGFSFFNEGTGVRDFGYLTMTNTGTTGFPSTITSWSFENTGAAITVAAPAVPENGSTAALLTISALVMGALGMRKWRREETA